MKTERHKNGAIAEAEVQAELVRRGISVSIPTTEESYDMIADTGEKLIKVQVKNAFLVERSGGKTDAYRAEFRTRHYDTSGDVQESRYSEGDIDAYAIYNPDHDEIYWLPFEDAPETQASRTLKSWQDHKIDKKLG